MTFKTKMIAEDPSHRKIEVIFSGDPTQDQDLTLTKLEEGLGKVHGVESFSIKE